VPMVLVADDDADIRELVAFRLGQAGFHVVVAEDGPSALEATREHKPDLIVLDVMMPGMSGLDVCREIRRDGLLAHVPGILLTAKAQEADVQQGFDAGAYYVIKPFSPRELMARVEAVLSRERR